MGQKGNAIGFRLQRNKKWRSRWYTSKKLYGDLIQEDLRIRKFIMTRPSCSGTSRVIISRMSEKIEVNIHTARPGLVIGKKGVEIDRLKTELFQLTGKEVWVEVTEIKRPDLDAYLVADSLVRQLERRIPFRKAMKKAMQASMDAGAKGIKVQVSGRLGGAEIARSEWYIEGSIPLHTLRIDIDYAAATAHTSYGAIGVKVWINRGEDSLLKEAV